MEITEERWVLSNQRDVAYKPKLKQALRNLPKCEENQSAGNREPILYSLGKFQRRSQYTQFTSASLFNKIRVGSVISVKTASNRSQHNTSSETNSVISFFAINGLAFANGKIGRLINNYIPANPHRSTSLITLSRSFPFS